MVSNDDVISYDVDNDVLCDDNEGRIVCGCLGVNWTEINLGRTTVAVPLTTLSYRALFLSDRTLPRYPSTNHFYFECNHYAAR